jgi:hypothetical protein
MREVDRPFRIATWNLERPAKYGYTKNAIRLEKIYEIDADIWVLTETNSAIDLSDRGYKAIASPPIENYHKKGENLATIWTRLPIARQIETFDSTAAVCGEVESPFGPILVYGTVIPYADDKGEDGNSKRWEEHRKSLLLHHQDWLRIRREYLDRLFCIAGDINLSLDGSGWYENARSIEILNNALEDLEMVCVTKDNYQKTKGLSRSTIDHIFLPKSLSDRAMVEVWEGTDPRGEKMSDHNGILVDL